MQLVLDSNVAIKWRLPEADSDKALIVRQRYLTLVYDLIAPDIFTV